MGLIKQVTSWSYDGLLDYISVNPTRDEVTHYKVDPNDESDESIMKLRTEKDFSSITCLDYSSMEVGMIGVGERSGYIRLFDITVNDHLEYDTFDIKTRAKQLRCINTIGINNNGLIAMGLDRNRNDASLQVWDVNYQDSTTEFVNPTFSFCVNESIVSLKFLNETAIIVASTKLLKEIDLRSPNPIFQYPSRLTYDIKLNPFNEWQFSTYGDDGTLAIWDRRKLVPNFNTGDLLAAQPLLQFDKLVGTGAASRKYMNSCFRWSAVRNNEFATLHRGEVIKRWQLGSYKNDVVDEYDTNVLFVYRVRDVNTTFDKVVTFDYIPKENQSCSVLCMRQSGTVYRMPINESYSCVKFNNYNSIIFANGEIPTMDELKVEDDEQSTEEGNVSVALENLSFEDLDVGDEYSEHDHDETYETLSNHSNQDNNEQEPNFDDEDYDHENLETFNHSLFWKPEKLLERDISVVMRMRATLGYGLDAMRTVETIDQSKYLQNYSYIRNTWKWIAIAKASVDDGTMVSGDLDLGFEGILGIWNGLHGLSNQKRYREGAILTEKQLNKEMEKIIRLRRRYKASMGYKESLAKTPDSGKNTQRKLCLIISGWDLTPTDYEDKYQKIIASGNYEKAAAWAVFFGDIPKAVEILGSAKRERLRLIGTAISGYMAYKDKPGDNAWRQQCRKMSSELENPYLRVIFAFIADNDWWDILYEPAISLREKLGVALRNLNDTDLTRFLERTSYTMIENGELEGLILTGITPSGIDLLQSYVSKTSDVQSAALISIFGSPRYFQDERVDEWVQTYRSMLNSWGLFLMRSKFDVLRTKLSRTSAGVVTAKIKSRQLFIQCMNCKKNINSSSFNGKSHNESSEPLDFKRFGNKKSVKDNPRKKHSCPHCGTSFPHCAICLLPLGTTNLPFTIEGFQNKLEIQDDALSEFGEKNSEEIMKNKIYKSRKLRLNEWFSFCLSCNHGMHAGHAEEWFNKHSVCPTPRCTCQCNK
ncbi:hypothetical protein TBLA_0I00920 [Henningerozyma blattae CBS 6284]|uniref:Uncharacterized protein n=1 Tax=Henningerozyma blattae (strain ATCC 34711 / CBS 6284 / DSM 70876 / NBRC 10599 / NRRL Y-10934 / UCD 77-7) TaxID=1071380 RepID=I2H8P9_HENB6|nr:hypothetical protein TBLA_0I00920 [Tetrapisispora blattae CBS 6284]CCH62751.1 hypothetical protein TBLA_0I00920 [Tetrapisispora blattae CBS 6284]